MPVLRTAALFSHSGLEKRKSRLLETSILGDIGLMLMLMELGLELLDPMTTWAGEMSDRWTMNVRLNYRNGRSDDLNNSVYFTLISLCFGGITLSSKDSIMLSDPHPSSSTF